MKLTRVALIASLALAPGAILAQTTPAPGQHDSRIRSLAESIATSTTAKWANLQRLDPLQD
jgi:hypothetical protein